jgi:hypothetical protein
MKCFGHPGSDALGTCVHCGRGVCGECATPIETAQLSCSSGCADKLRAKHRDIKAVETLSDELLSRADRTGRAKGRLTAVFSLFLLIMAVVFTVQDGEKDWTFIGFLYILGFMMSAVTVSIWRNSFRYVGQVVLKRSTD